MPENLTADALYDICRQAGFTPDQSVTMTAIALAESGGNPHALAVGANEHSIGLFQINLVAHPTYTADQLQDPLANARAAFEVSHGGRDVAPWMVTHLSGDNARYQQFQSVAVAAAEAHGDHGAHGEFAGVGGSGAPPPAAAAGADHGADGHPDGGHHTGVQGFVDEALAQQGDAYVLGAQTALNDHDPHTFDCSSLVQWAAHQEGVELPRTAESQYLQLRGMHATLSVEEALHTPGALLFHFPQEPVPGQALGGNAHVAISLGDGRTIEAIGTKWGVKTVDVASFHTGGKAFFTNAAFVPGLAEHAESAIDHPELGAPDPHAAPVAPVVASPAGVAPAVAAAAPAAHDLPPLGGFWSGGPAEAAPHVLDVAGPGHDAGAHGLPALPPLGLLATSGHAAGDPLAAGVLAQGPGRSLPLLDAAPHAAATGLPALPSMGSQSAADQAASTAAHSLVDPTHVPADDHHLAVDDHHLAVDHGDPGALLPGEVHLHDLGDGHLLPGESLLHDIDDHHALLSHDAHADSHELHDLHDGLGEHHDGLHGPV